MSNNLTKTIIRQLKLDDPSSVVHSQKIEAANNFEQVYMKVDPRVHVIKTSIFRQVQYIAAHEPYNEHDKTKEAIMYASSAMYTAKGEEDYRKALKFLQESF